MFKFVLRRMQEKYKGWRYRKMVVTLKSKKLFTELASKESAMQCFTS